MRIATEHSSDMLAKAGAYAATLHPRERATVLALSGDLGAGKTNFVQGMAQALGVTEHVTSPTFVIERIYPLSGQSFSKLIHIDAYRLESEHELEVLGWKEIAADASNLIAIEWPERVPGLIPEEAVKLRFEIDGDGRTITINDGEESGTES